MKPIKPTQDIQPISTFRTNSARLLEQARQTGRPLILTQRGQSAAVVLSVESYEELLEELELLRDLATARRQLEEGASLSHQEAYGRLKGKFGQ